MKKCSIIYYEILCKYMYILAKCLMFATDASMLALM